MWLKFLWYTHLAAEFPPWVRCIPVCGMFFFVFGDHSGVGVSPSRRPKCAKRALGNRENMCFWCPKTVQTAPRSATWRSVAVDEMHIFWAFCFLKNRGRKITSAIIRPLYRTTPAITFRPSLFGYRFLIFFKVSFPPKKMKQVLLRALIDRWTHSSPVLWWWWWFTLNLFWNEWKTTKAACSKA